MEKREELVEELDEAAWDVARVEVDDPSWTILGARVVELIARADAMLALGDRTGGDVGPAVRWDRTDPPVVLARALGTVHRRLAAMAEPVPPAHGSDFAA